MNRVKYCISQLFDEITYWINSFIMHLQLSYSSIVGCGNWICFALFFNSQSMRVYEWANKGIKKWWCAILRLLESWLWPLDASWEVSHSLLLAFIFPTRTLPLNRLGSKLGMISSGNILGRSMGMMRRWRRRSEAQVFIRIVQFFSDLLRPRWINDSFRDWRQL